jgi:hypothetical protein
VRTTFATADWFVDGLTAKILRFARDDSVLEFDDDNQKSAPIEWARSFLCTTFCGRR